MIAPPVIIAMPLNADGNGPETDPSKIVRTVFELWDDDFTTIGTYETEREAIEARKQILLRDQAAEIEQFGDLINVDL